MFSIQFLPGLTEEGAAAGQLRLGDQTEGFHANLGFWPKGEYQRQWERSLSRVVSGESDRGCLITSIPPLATANFVFWWVLYRDGDRIAFQQHILFLEELSEPFDPSAPELSMSAWETENEDGEKISQWWIPLEDVRAFLAAKPFGPGAA